MKTMENAEGQKAPSVEEVMRAVRTGIKDVDWSKLAHKFDSSESLPSPRGRGLFPRFLFRLEVSLSLGREK